MKEQILIALVMVGILVLAGSCGVMRYRECRTDHPWWYCLGRN
jgi:hypothetical protein